MTRPLIVTTQDHSLVVSDDCEHFQTRTMTSFPSQVQSQEQRAVALEGVDTLRVRASHEGGVTVKGWDRPVARLTVCKYAVALNQIDAQKTLRDVFVFYRNGEIATSGPEVDRSILGAISDLAGHGFAGHRVHRDAGGRERVVEAWS